MISFKGYNFRHTQVGDTLVLFLSTTPVVAKDFLGQEIKIDGNTYVVYETTDPYRPPHVDPEHKNEGKFAELKVRMKGEEVPEPYDTNVEVKKSRPMLPGKRST